MGAEALRLSPARALLAKHGGDSLRVLQSLSGSCCCVVGSRDLLEELCVPTSCSSQMYSAPPVLGAGVIQGVILCDLCLGRQLKCP